MDVLVMLEEGPDHSTVLAHVNSVPSPLNSESPGRDMVTLYGVATPDGLALRWRLRGIPSPTGGEVGHDSPPRALAGARRDRRCGVAR